VFCGLFLGFVLISAFPNQQRKRVPSAFKIVNKNCLRHIYKRRIDSMQKSILNTYHFTPTRSPVCIVTEIAGRFPAKENIECPGEIRGLDLLLLDSR
jgi:hypothetical protein